MPSKPQWTDQLRHNIKAASGLLLFTLSGCVSQEEHQNATALLSSEIATLQTKLDATQSVLQELSAEEIQTREQTAAVLSEVRSQLAALPEDLSVICPEPAAALPTPICEERPAVQTVVTVDDKMIVGELERVWVDPPGKSLIARMDTGATSSSLHAEELVKFERDGDDWVRFNVIIGEEVETLERKVERYVRVYQQADAEGSRRPVVNLRLRLGNIQDTFEFTLADRAHLEYQFILGRNFLTDIAVVDVSKQFVQPRYTPPKP